MTDFAGRVLRSGQPDWIIRSLLDVDFYKFTMGYFIHRFHPGVQVKFSLINRHTQIPLADIIDEQELRAQLDHVRTLRVDRTNIYYLRGMDVYGERMFSEEFLSFLGKLQLPPYELRRIENQYELTFEAPWEEVTWWETIALAIISELFYRKLMQTMTSTELRILYARATDKLYNKLKIIKRNGNIRFACFAQRRRHSHLWQKFAIEMAHEVLDSQFAGTSNTWMAFNQDLTPIGTNAHELPMVLTALAPSDEEKRMAQYKVLEEWGACFPNQGLRIMLPDTYGSAQFFEGMPKDLAHSIAHTWRGMRQDSGKVFEEGERYMKWLWSHKANPAERLFIPSDGLDVGSMIEIDQRLGRDMNISNGWGTKFANDFEGCHPHGGEFAVVNGVHLPLTNDALFRGHSIVCKVVSANGNPAVKLSNNVNKATGPRDEVDRYLSIFGHKGRGAQEVIV